MLPATLPEVFALALLVGLTGAMAPGPVLVATIDSSLVHGRSAGPRIGFGHVIIESGVVLLVLGGVGAVAASHAAIIGIVGGGALIVFGVMTVRGAFDTREKMYRGLSKDPVLVGILTSAANPYFWIWWGTIGSAFLFAGIAGGFVMIAVFMFGHWTADLAWLTIVSYGVHRGRIFLADRWYREVLIACGIFLVLFGGYFLFDSIGSWILREV